MHIGALPVVFGQLGVGFCRFAHVSLRIVFMHVHGPPRRPPKLKIAIGLRGFEPSAGDVTRFPYEGEARGECFALSQ